MSIRWFYAIGTVPLTLVCSLGLAMLLNQKVKFRNFFRTVSFFPYVASLVAVAAVWNMIFSPSMGPVNQILATLGVENLPKWAAGKDTAMLTVILFSVWKNMGYYMVIYLAGLQGTNPELEEAAEAGRCQQVADLLECNPAAAEAHHLLRYHHADHRLLQGV